MKLEFVDMGADGGHNLVQNCLLCCEEGWFCRISAEAWVVVLEFFERRLFAWRVVR